MVIVAIVSFFSGIKCLVCRNRGFVQEYFLTHKLRCTWCHFEWYPPVDKYLVEFHRNDFSIDSTYNFNRRRGLE